MGKQFKTERAAQQQRRIEDSLVELMTAKSYGEISVSEICSSAVLPRRTFYYYFNNKEEVLTALLARLLNECSLETISAAATQREVLQESLARFFRFWHCSARKELSALVHSKLEQEVITAALEWVHSETIWKMLADNSPQGIQLIRPLLAVTCVFYTLFYWYNCGFQQTPEQLADYMTQVLTNPIYQVK